MKSAIQKYLEIGIKNKDNENLHSLLADYFAECERHMDADIVEKLQHTEASESEYEFLAAYCMDHAIKFNEEFII